MASDTLSAAQRTAPVAARSLLAESWLELRAVLRFRGLIRYMISAALKTENTGRLFGRLWWLLDPFLIMVTYVLLINVIYDAGGTDYPVFVFISVVVWKWFATSSEAAIYKILSMHFVMKQVAFPKAVLPISSVLGGTIDFIFGMLAVILFALAYGIYPDLTLAFFPVLVVIQFVFTLGMAFFLSALNVFFRDVKNLSSHFFRIWFYLSPGLYTISLIPPDWQTLYKLNPFSVILPAYHDVVMYHSAPDWSALGIVAVFALATCTAGYLFFMKLSPQFIKAI